MRELVVVLRVVRVGETCGCGVRGRRSPSPCGPGRPGALEPGSRRSRRVAASASGPADADPSVGMASDRLTITHVAATSEPEPRGVGRPSADGRVVPMGSADLTSRYSSSPNV